MPRFRLCLLAALLVLSVSVAGSAFAVGGETIETATLIPGLPYEDSGSTCGHVNDYDEVCPYGGSTAPDVVYRFEPATDIYVTITVCNSNYDTKLYLYGADGATLIDCNDDGCIYENQSSLGVNLLAGGSTYYIVVDGYGVSCGPYNLELFEFHPCVVECPPGALVEGEPPCVDDHIDQYNGGCSTGGWTEVMAQAEGCATMCGRTCTYTYHGLTYRDTDWFSARSAGGPVVASCTAEFLLHFIFIYGADCDHLEYSWEQVSVCETTTLLHDIPAGVEFWLWVGPSVYTGVPESDYLLEVCNIEAGATPTTASTWGALKARFLDAPDLARTGGGVSGDGSVHVTGPRAAPSVDGGHVTGFTGVKRPTKPGREPGE